MLSASSVDHQSINSSCLKAKSKMLAHLSLPSCSENSTRKHHEICRRKTSCPTGFGHMTNKKEGMQIAHWPALFVLARDIHSTGVLIWYSNTIQKEKLVVESD